MRTVNEFPAAWIEKIYAGWLGKIIGIRLGAPVEGWTREKIRETYGEQDGYLRDYLRFAADDDSNGPLFFVRALEDSGKKAEELCSQDVAEAILNYVPVGHGFFWWGGYGVSTEHTAYMNLLSGMDAPESGSIRQNGAMVAEQIGGQIFIDTWGLVAPGDPDLAAKMAREAASVMHDGEGVNGGVFVAVCISYAFVETDIRKIIEKGLSYLPPESTYRRVAEELMDFHRAHPDRWEDCMDYVASHHGYDKYPGNCHIIPNAAVIVLSLLYGEGDFTRTIQICNRCGWDTDCNVGNTAAIMGVRCGLDGIADAWRRPVNDFLAAASVLGSLNNTDIPACADYFVRLAAGIRGEKLPEKWLCCGKDDVISCHFAYPGSTHAMEAYWLDEQELVREGAEAGLDMKRRVPEKIMNTNLFGDGQDRCLCTAPTENPEHTGRLYLSKRTYLFPDDFSDNRYLPAFSPTVYPGQVIRARVGAGTLEKGENGAEKLFGYLKEHPAGDTPVRLYVYCARTGKYFYSPPTELSATDHEDHATLTVDADHATLAVDADHTVYADPADPAHHEQKQNSSISWADLSWQIPDTIGELISEIGIVTDGTLPVYLDSLCVMGEPYYHVDFSQERTERWTSWHQEVSQYTRRTGHLFLENDKLHLTGAEEAEAFTGSPNWKDYSFCADICPLKGEEHYISFRVQGGMRSYFAGLGPGGSFEIWKKSRKEMKRLAVAPFSWKCGKTYEITVTARENTLAATVKHKKMQDENIPATLEVTLQVTDPETPYMHGCIGFRTGKASHLSCSGFSVAPAGSA